MIFKSAFIPEVSRCSIVVVVFGTRSVTDADHSPENWPFIMVDYYTPARGIMGLIGPEGVLMGRVEVTNGSTGSVKVKVTLTPSQEVLDKLCSTWTFLTHSV